MKKLLNLLEIIDKYSFVVSIICMVFGFFVNKFCIYIKQFRIRKLLALKKAECKIILPSYTKEVHSPNDIHEVCPIGDIKSMANVIDLINQAGLAIQPRSIIYEPSYDMNIDSYNIFCIGGSLANRCTYDTFQLFSLNLRLMHISIKLIIILITFRQIILN